jgi:sugar phosphate isomerase/epimerase
MLNNKCQISKTGTRVARRTFLTGLAASPLLADVTPRRMKMNLACGAIGVKASQLEAIDLAYRNGFEAVEPKPEYLASLSDAELAKLTGDLKTKNLVWGVASLPADLRADESKFAASMQGLPKFAETLRRAGVSRVSKFIYPNHPTLTYVRNFKLHARRVAEIAVVLDGQGLRFGLEYVGPRTSLVLEQYPFIHTMAETKELIAAAGKRNVGFVLDSFLWYTAHETAADILSLEGKDVISADISDAPAGIPIDQLIDQRRELPCATGVIDLGAFLNALNKIGFDGPVRAEPFNEAVKKMPREEAVAATSRAMKKAFALIQ